MNNINHYIEQYVELNNIYLMNIYWMCINKYVHIYLIKKYKYIYDLKEYSDIITEISRIDKILLL